jgi:hypothetical protein
MNCADGHDMQWEDGLFVCARCNAADIEMARIKKHVLSQLWVRGFRFRRQP